MDLNPYSIFLSMIFGLIGYAAWKSGRRTNKIRSVVIAIALMTFPYFVTGVPQSLLVGGVLVFFLFWP